MKLYSVLLCLLFLTGAFSLQGATHALRPITTSSQPSSPILSSSFSKKKQKKKHKRVKENKYRFGRMALVTFGIMWGLSGGLYVASLVESMALIILFGGTIGLLSQVFFVLLGLWLLSVLVKKAKEAG
ncbi:MAG: hypothetical protein AAFY71_16400 [Bacteroidota bacterium]